MKELTLEQKARAYDKVLERAKLVYKYDKFYSGVKDAVETIFSEIREK